MVRDPGRSRRRARDAGASSPVDQLEAWRDWRHDTAEFPPVSDAPPGPRPPHRRPRRGVVVGAALLFAVLAVTGVTALGVGPVAHLVGSRTGAGNPARTPSTPGGADPAGPTGSAAARSSSPAVSPPSRTGMPTTVPRPVIPMAPTGAPGADSNARPGPRAGPGNGRGAPPRLPGGGPAG